jgi:hypothetical protein
VCAPLPPVLAAGAKIPGNPHQRVVWWKLCPLSMLYPLVIKISSTLLFISHNSVACICLSLYLVCRFTSLLIT